MAILLATSHPHGPVYGLPRSRRSLLTEDRRGRARTRRQLNGRPSSAPSPPACRGDRQRSKSLSNFLWSCLFVLSCDVCNASKGPSAEPEEFPILTSSIKTGYICDSLLYVLGKLRNGPKYRPFSANISAVMVDISAFTVHTPPHEGADRATRRTFTRLRPGQ